MQSVPRKQPVRNIQNYRPKSPQNLVGSVIMSGDETTQEKPEEPPDPRLEKIAEEARLARLECTTRAKPTKALAESFRRLMEIGMPISHACGFLRISETSVHRWRKTIPEWIEAVETGRALFVAEHLSGITKASKKNWQASAWLLERTQPKYFSRAQEMAIGHSMSHALSADVLSRLAEEEPNTAISVESEAMSVGNTIQDSAPQQCPPQKTATLAPEDSCVQIDTPPVPPPSAARLNSIPLSESPENKKTQDAAPYIDAKAVLSRDPLDFRDWNKNRIDDRLEKPADNPAGPL